MKIRTMRLLSREGMSNVVRNKLMSLASMGTVIIALLLLGLVLLVAINVKSNMEQVRKELEVLVFLNIDINDLDRETIKAFIVEREAAGEVASWTYESKEEAYQNLQDSFSDPALLKGMTAAEMAESFTIRLSDPENGAQFIEPLSQLPGIQPAPDGINYPQQTLERITGFADIINSVTLILMGIMLVISVFIISNTIRLTVFARRKEIEIMRHVGALDSFIRMPFFVEGVLIGILSATAASLLTWKGYGWIHDTLNVMLKDLGFGMFNLLPFDPMAMRIVLLYFIIGTAIGGIGSLISVRKHLNV
jgi:cell division transport system permease protein